MVKFCVKIYCSTILLLINIQPGFGSDIDSLINQGIELSIVHNYAAAESIFANIISENPDSPAGYFFMAATIQSKMMDFESDRWEEIFHHFIQKTLSAAEKQLAENSNDSYSLFYQGSALSYLAFYNGRKKEYISALKNAVAGVSKLKELSEIDPDFEDVYFGLGSYKYWRSHATRHLNWLPLLSDDRTEGIRMVQRTVENGRYTRYAAMNQLIWMLLDAGRSGEAFSWALRGLGKFPTSRFFLWGAAKSALSLQNLSDAEDYFNRLLNSITAEPLNNGYNEYICRINLAEIYFEQEKHSRAAAQIEKFSAMKLTPEIWNRLDDQRERADQLTKKMLKIGALQHSSTTKDELADK